jgi:hypothetical protein
MDKMDHLMAEKERKIIKTAKRGMSHQKKYFKKSAEIRATVRNVPELDD